MMQNNKVVWSEGLFLWFQYLQQYECYLECFVELCVGVLCFYIWGFIELELEIDLFVVGKFGIKCVCGVFFDGMLFVMFGDDLLLLLLDVDGNWCDQIVYFMLLLCLLIQFDSGCFEVLVEKLFCYCVCEVEVCDVFGSIDGIVLLEVGGMISCFLFELQLLEGFIWLLLVCIVECCFDCCVMFDEGFMFSVFSVEVVLWLVIFFIELFGLLY